MRMRGEESTSNFPKEMGGPGSRQCGLLRKTLYSTRDDVPKLGVRAWRLLGEDWLAQETREHVLILRRDAGNQRCGPW